MLSVRVSVLAHHNAVRIHLTFLQQYYVLGIQILQHSFGPVSATFLVRWSYRLIHKRTHLLQMKRKLSAIIWPTKSLTVLRWPLIDYTRGRGSPSMLGMDKLLQTFIERETRYVKQCNTSTIFTVGGKSKSPFWDTACWNKQITPIYWRQFSLKLWEGKHFCINLWKFHHQVTVLHAVKTFVVASRWNCFP